jgi:hypothetical protein
MTFDDDTPSATISTVQVSMVDGLMRLTEVAPRCDSAPQRTELGFQERPWQDSNLRHAV